MKASIYWGWIDKFAKSIFDELRPWPNLDGYYWKKLIGNRKLVSDSNGAVLRESADAPQNCS